MPNFEKSLFYRDNCINAKRAGDGVEYTIKCIDGTGTMLCYEVFSGVELFLNSLQPCKKRQKALRKSPLMQVLQILGNFRNHSKGAMA